MSVMPTDAVCEVRFQVPRAGLPRVKDIRTWVALALRIGGARLGGGLVVRVVDEAESQHLNMTYRRTRGPTNVLSFSYAGAAVVLPPGQPRGLGDIVLCAPLIARQAAAQHKSRQAHWAHLVVHGVLHLLGHDHDRKKQREQMEAIEIAILGSLGFADPYIDPAAG